jgi:hypothetical protein
MGHVTFDELGHGKSAYATPWSFGFAMPHCRVVLMTRGLCTKREGTASVKVTAFGNSVDEDLFIDVA